MRGIKIALSLVATVAVIVVFFVTVPIVDTTEADYTVSEFSLEDYSSYLDECPSDLEIGLVDGVEDALEKTKVVWVEEYGDSVWVQECMTTDNWPIKIFYDQDNGCWFFFGLLPSNTKGGTPCIIFNTEGDVMALWHGQ